MTVVAVCGIVVFSVFWFRACYARVNLQNLGAAHTEATAPSLSIVVSLFARVELSLSSLLAVTGDTVADSVVIQCPCCGVVLELTEQGRAGPGGGTATDAKQQLNKPSSGAAVVSTTCEKPQQPLSVVVGLMELRTHRGARGPWCKGRPWS